MRRGEREAERIENWEGWLGTVLYPQFSLSFLLFLRALRGLRGEIHPRSRSASVVTRRTTSVRRTASPIAFLVPTSTTSRLPRVMAVYSRFRWSMGKCWVWTGTTTAGYSLPWLLWTVVA